MFVTEAKAWKVLCKVSVQFPCQPWLLLQSCRTFDKNSLTVRWWKQPSAEPCLLERC